MFHSGGNLTLKPEIANKLVKEFMSRERVNPAMRVTQLAKGWSHVGLVGIHLFTYTV